MNLLIGGFGGFFIGLWVICLLAGGWIWPYVIGTWSTYLGNPIEVPFIIGVILGLIPVTSQLTLPALILTWLIF